MKMTTWIAITSVEYRFTMNISSPLKNRWCRMRKRMAAGLCILMPLALQASPSVYSNALQNAAALETLDLRDLGMKQLPPSVGQFKNLKKLYLNGNPLSTLPTEIGELKNLEELTMGDSTRALKTLPEAVGQLENLRVLNIWMHDMRKLPSTVCQLRNLRKLMVAGGKTLGIRHELAGKELAEYGIVGEGGGYYHIYGGLAEVPDQIGLLTNLTHLTITYHQVQELPESSALLNRLKSLRVEHGALKKLPAGIGRCTALKELRINDNPAIDRLPDSFVQLTNLSAFAIALNPSIRHLPEEFGNLQALEQMAMRNTRLEYLPDSIADLSNLRMLWLQDSDLNTLPPSFVSLTSLQLAHLNLPQLRKLPEPLTALNRLVYLTIKGSGLTNLPSDIARLRGLRMIDLRDTGIRRLPQTLTPETDYPVLDVVWIDHPDDPVFAHEAEKHGWIINPDQTRTRELTGAAGYAVLGSAAEGNYQVSLRPAALQKAEHGRLNLKASRLDALDFTALDGSAIERLDLDYCEMDVLGRQYKSRPLVGFEEFLKSCKQLRHLNLSVNRLTDVPDYVFKLPSLETVDLSANPFSSEQLSRLRKRFSTIQFVYEPPLAP